MTTRDPTFPSRRNCSGGSAPWKLDGKENEDQRALEVETAQKSITSILEGDKYELFINTKIKNLSVQRLNSM